MLCQFDIYDEKVILDWTMGIGQHSLSLPPTLLHTTTN
jgi:hypothetical protein